MLKNKNYTESIEQISLKYYPNNQCTLRDLLTNDLELCWNTICEINRHRLYLVMQSFVFHNSKLEIKIQYNLKWLLNPDESSNDSKTYDNDSLERAL